MSNFDITNFLAGLQNAQPKPRETNFEQKPKVLEKVYLSVPDNLGKYQVFPMNSVVTGFPFVYMNRTREFYMERKIVNRDPSKEKLYAWYKLLPHSAYQFLDSTGRLVSSLTQAESDLLSAAHATFDKLSNILDQANKSKGLIRYKNYTIFNAKCINKFRLGDVTKPERSNFSALFVCTARDFANAVQTNINDSQFRFGGNNDWVSQVYNRELTNRTGWLVFTISKASNGIGYSVTASHDANLPASATEGFVITDEEAEAMKDPVSNFLGWQAGDSKNLFNAQLIQEVIDEMTKTMVQYQSVGSTVNMGMVTAATQATAQAATIAPQQATPVTNDPMVAAFQQNNVAPQQAMSQSPEQMAVRNDNPFVTPPAAHMDPVTQMPINVGQQAQQPQQQYVQPQFAQQQYYQQPSQQGQPEQVNNPFLNAGENPYKQ